MQMGLNTMVASGRSSVVCVVEDDLEEGHHAHARPIQRWADSLNLKFKFGERGNKSR